MAMMPEDNVARYLPSETERRMLMSIVPPDTLSIAERLQADIVEAVLQYRADKLVHEELSRAWYALPEGEQKTVTYHDMLRSDEIEKGSLARIDLLAGRLAEAKIAR